MFTRLQKSPLYFALAALNMPCASAGWHSAIESSSDNLRNMHDLITALIAAVPSTVAIIIVGLQNNARFNAMNTRFDDMRDLWRAELKRVEEVLDARLKHIEETRR